MDYYMEMRARMDKYRRIHTARPRVALIKMLLWNIYFLMKSDKDKKEEKDKKNVNTNAPIMKSLQRYDAENKNRLYKTTDDLIELQRELLENNKERMEARVRQKLCQKDGETVEIVLITDDNYAVQTAIAISSLYYNADRNTRYHVNVLGMELSDRAAEMIRRSGTYVDVISCGNIFEKYDFHHEHVTKAALYKFKICDILSDLPRVLYLDSDVLVQKDLSSFYQTEIDDRYAAVVKDFHVMSKKYIGIGKMGLTNYFNSGVMLLNTAKMREEKLSAKLLMTKQELNMDRDFSFMDQDTLNLVFHENVIFASADYNFLNAYYYEISKNEMADLCQIPKDEVYEIYDTPAILHIGGKSRPWESNTGEKALLYRKYMVINRMFREIFEEERTSEGI